MRTTRKLLMATALVSLAGSTGCLQFLTKAVKGEVTPIGVTQASESDIYSLSSTIATENDPAKFTKAFTDLGSVYLYKCLENPTMAPREGKAEVREAAGEALLAAMHKRVAMHDLGGDPVLAAASGDIAAFQGKMTKCDAEKLAKNDTGNQFAQAVELAQPAGRDAYVEKTAQGLDGDLEAAMADERQVSTWAYQTCPNLLPQWSYCVPRAVEAYYAKGEWASIVTVFLSGSDKRVADVLPALAQRAGKDKVVADAKGYMLGKGSAPPAAPSGLDVLVGFLRDNGAWGSCDDRTDLLKRSLHGDTTQLALWSITKVVEDQCHNLDDDLVKSLGSDSPWVREKAAWASGELGIQKAKKHLERLRYSDPYRDDGCWCYPVRDAASNAYNKLELANG